jgi:hypothetical protein
MIINQIEQGNDVDPSAREPWGCAVSISADRNVHGRGEAVKAVFIQVCFDPYVKIDLLQPSYRLSGR